MQTVSQAWKNAHKQTLLNESFVEISMDITDPDALEEAESSDNGAVYISNTPEVVSEVDTPVIPYGTLEQNIWLLDGKRSIIPDNNYQDGGYVGDELSNEEGVFDKKIPTITIDFGRVFTKLIPGLTITWGTAYSEYATHFIITAYNGDTVVATKEISDNDKVISLVNLDIVNYDRITIQILGWCLPKHRARVDEIFVGWNKIYSKANLMSYSHEQIVDPISTSLPKMEIKFSIDNSDNSYNPLNPDSMAKYLIERQSVNVRYGLKTSNNTTEWIKGGTFYLSEWYAQQNGISAEFGARDILEFMSSNYKDDTYKTYTPAGVAEIKRRSLYTIATEVLSAANLPLNSNGTARWIIDDSLKLIYASAPLPNDTIANCLQLIANAGCCVLYPDRDGQLHIEPISTTPTDYVVNSYNSYLKPEITLSKLIKEIRVKVYEYTIGEKGVESTATEKIYSVNATGESITVDNPLITDTARAEVVGKWIGDYLKNRMTVKTVTRADVSLEPLDIISNESEFITNTMRMTNVKFEYNGAFKGTGEGRVIEDG